MSFKRYPIEVRFPRLLNESLQAHTQHITHLSHAEDLGHEYGHEGTTHDSNLTTKVDGGVSIVAGHHPHTGKFFVGYKEAIKDIGGEKEAKLAYSHEDIDKHFEGKPYLQDKMKAAFNHVHKVLPKKGVYQGDFLFTPEAKHEHAGKVGFTSNTITYSAGKNSAESHKIDKAHMGISFHIAYDHKNGHLQSRPVEPDELKHSDDVYHLSTANDTHRAHFTDEAKAAFQHHMKKAEDLHKSGGQEMYNSVTPHSAHLSTYINKTVREGTKPSVEGLKEHIVAHGEREAGKVKTEKAQAQKREKSATHVAHVEANHDQIHNYLQMHHHLQHAKNELVKTLDRADHPLEHTIEGKKTSPEGYVFHHAGAPIKLVNREEFSKKNFEKSRD